MGAVNIMTMAGRYVAVRSANSTDASYPSRPYTLTKPSGTGVLDLANGGGMVENTFNLIPFGVGSATNTFLMRILGWSRDLSSPPCWIWTVIGEYTCTLSTFAGLTGCIINASQLVCDTVALVAGTATANVSSETVSPTGNIPAHIQLSMKGHELAEFIFNMNSSATSANCAVRKL